MTVNRNAPLYQYPQEVWDEKTCERKAKHTAKDGLGTKYPFKGYIGSTASVPPAYGPHYWNGGNTYPDGNWYQGHNTPLPKVADGYEIIHILSWGWRIKRKDT
jgi:hypothetical protein